MPTVKSKSNVEFKTKTDNDSIHTVWTEMLKNSIYYDPHYHLRSNVFVRQRESRDRHK